MTEYKGPERRKQLENGDKEGRRKTDTRCPDHFLLWDHHDKDTENSRMLTCGKIKSLDEKKADRSEVGAIGKMLTAVIGIAIVVVGGLGYWLKHDIEIANENIQSSITTIHRRITENAEKRETALEKVSVNIGSLDATVQVINAKIARIEEDIKDARPAKSRRSIE